MCDFIYKHIERAYIDWYFTTIRKTSAPHMSEALVKLSPAETLIMINP